MSQENITKNKEEIENVDDVVRKIQSGSYTPVSQKEDSHSKSSEQLARRLLTERRACERIIIDSFFNSNTYKNAESILYQEALLKPSPDAISNFEFININAFTSTISKLLNAYINKSRSSDNLDSLKNSIEILDNQLISDKEIVRKINSNALITAGLGTANGFAYSVFSDFTAKRNRLKAVKVQPDPIKLKESLLKTIISQGTFLATFDLNDHSESLDILFGHGPNMKNISASIKEAMKPLEIFEGEIQNGEALRPSRETRTKLLALMKNSSESLKCPALKSVDGNRDTSGINIYLKFLANVYLILSGVETTNS